MTSFLFKSFAFTEKSTLTLYQNVICLLTRRKTKRENNDDRPITRSWNAFKKAKVRFYKYNCKLFTRNCLEMPGESVEKCVDRHQHSEVYFYTFRCLFIRLLLELLLLRRNAIQMSGNFNKCWMEWKKSRNKKKTLPYNTGYHQVEMLKDFFCCSQCTVHIQKC